MFNEMLENRPRWMSWYVLSLLLHGSICVFARIPTWIVWLYLLKDSFECRDLRLVFSTHTKKTFHEMAPIIQQIYNLRPKKLKKRKRKKYGRLDVIEMISGNEFTFWIQKMSLLRRFALSLFQWTKHISSGKWHDSNYNMNSIHNGCSRLW